MYGMKAPKKQKSVATPSIRGGAILGQSKKSMNAGGGEGSANGMAKKQIRGGEVC